MSISHTGQDCRMPDQTYLIIVCSYLAGRASAKQVNLAPERNDLSSLVGLHAIDGVGEEQVGVVDEHGAFWVVQLERPRGRLEVLHGPLAVSHTRHVQAM